MSRRPVESTHALVLVGAGHSHMLLLRRAHEYRRVGLSSCILTPEMFWYSGMATGVIGGEYREGAEQLPVAPLAKQHAVAHCCDLALRIDTAGQSLTLADGPPLPYDWLSLNTGSVVRPIAGAAGHPRVFRAKPVAELADFRRWLSAALTLAEAPRSALTSGRIRTTEILRAGGGTTGSEIAANVSALAQRRQTPVAVTLVCGSDRLVARLPRGASGALATLLRSRGIRLLLSTRVEAVDADTARLSSGEVRPFCALINATGLIPSPLLASSGLETNRDGALVVDKHLRSVSASNVFASGDCIAFGGAALPRVGVYAVRQAPVLHHNLLAVATGAPLRAFRPQRHYLSILNLGNRTALAVRGRLWACGGGPHRLKNWIDRRFMSRIAAEI